MKPTVYHHATNNYRFIYASTQVHLRMHLHRSIAGEGGKWHLALATEQHLPPFAICFFLRIRILLAVCVG